MNNRFELKSRDCKSALFSWQHSSPYKSTGKHLADTSSKMTTSDAHILVSSCWRTDGQMDICIAYWRLLKRLRGVASAFYTKGSNNFTILPSNRMQLFDWVAACERLRILTWVEHKFYFIPLVCVHACPPYSYNCIRETWRRQFCLQVYSVDLLELFVRRLGLAVSSTVLGHAVSTSSQRAPSLRANF